MKIIPCFTHPRGILGVYDFLLSDESNRSYIKNKNVKKNEKKNFSFVRMKKKEFQT